MRSFYFVIFLLASVQAEDYGDKFHPCGLYGFRCLDTKRAQMCDDKDENSDESTRKPIFFVCGDGLICNEEKKEYCSPGETSTAICTTTDTVLIKRNFHGSNDDDLDFNLSEITTENTSTSVDDDLNDEDAAPTEEPVTDQWNGIPPISCTSHGFYPGSNILSFLVMGTLTLTFPNRQRQQVPILLLRS